MKTAREIGQEIWKRTRDEDDAFDFSDIEQALIKYGDARADEALERAAKELETDNTVHPSDIRALKTQAKGEER